MAVDVDPDKTLTGGTAVSDFQRQVGESELCSLVGNQSLKSCGKELPTKVGILFGNIAGIAGVFAFFG